MAATAGFERGPGSEAEVGAEAPAPRPLRRRRSLPGSRAVVGGFLVASSVVGVFSAAMGTGDPPDQRYLVARRALAAGTRMSAADLALLPMRLPAPLASSGAFTDPAQLVGAVTVGPVGAGELVQAGDVLRKRGGPRSREVSLPIDLSRAVAGTLRPGDRVDVASTFGSGAEAYSVFVIRGAEVLALADTGGPLDESGGQVLTLSLSSASDALALAHAISAGQLTVVRATGAPPAGAEPYRAPSAHTAEAER